jgi:signal transduction histidine kinase
MLAQASTELTGSSFSPIRIDDLLWQARTDLLTRFPDFSVNIEMHEEFDDAADLTISGNEMLLKTAMTNIIENGCKYSDNHCVGIDLTKIGETLVLHFTDNGIGISNKEMDMIFQPFYRSKSVKNQEGHGIGLSLVEKIITLHKGTISVTSEVGKGSDFMIRLPLAKKAAK